MMKVIVTFITPSLKTKFPMQDTPTGSRKILLQENSHDRFTDKTNEIFCYKAHAKKQGRTQSIPYKGPYMFIYSHIYKGAIS